MSLFVCPCKAPSQPRCVGHHGLQSGLPSPSSPTEMGIPFFPGHPTCSPPSGDQPLCLHPAQLLCPSAVFAGFLYVCNPAGAAAEGFLGVPHVSANTYLKNCSHGSIFLLSLFSEVFPKHFSQGLTRCPPCFTGLQSHSSACSPFPEVYPV